MASSSFQQAATVDSLKAALPKSFDFYHLGRVSMQEKATPVDLENSFGIAFTIYSFKTDQKFVLVVATSNPSNVDTFTEVGNILASKLATDFSKDADYLTTPPKILTSKALELMVKSQRQLLAQDFRLESARGQSDLQVLILQDVVRMEIRDV